MLEGRHRLLHLFPLITYFKSASQTIFDFWGVLVLQKSLAAILVLLAVFSTILGYSTKSSLDTVFENVLKTSSQAALNEGARPFNERELRLPAVGNDGEGSLADLRAYLARGSGKVYVRIDTENPILNPDSQESVKIAVDVAKQVSNRDTSNVNIYYDIESSTQVVGGRSATAALAIATIALLRNETLRPGVLISATIESDDKGSLGKVNGILAKAQAAKAGGFSELIIAPGAAEDHGASVESQTGIEITEAETIFDAYQLMKAK